MTATKESEASIAELATDMDKALVERVARAIAGASPCVDESCWREFADQARAAIASCFEWQPIETAPRDGTPFWGWVDGQEATECVFHNDAYWPIRALDEYERVGAVEYYPPTHWLPLPPPPVTP